MSYKTRYGAAGNLYEAIRTVTKIGSIRFDGDTFQDDLLKAYAREKVIIQFDGDSAYSCGPVIAKELASNRRICRMECLKFMKPSAKDKKRILEERNTFTDFKADYPLTQEECFDAI